MATHSSILAWKSPWTEEPGRLQSMGLHDWACVHEGGGRWVGSSKPVELKKKRKKKTKILATGPITSWQIEKEKVEAVTDFLFLGSKITADGDCGHEIKRHLLLGKKAMTNLDNVLKNKDIILPTKVHIVKAMVFPVVMYRCESWSIKEAECQRIDTFILWYWKRLFSVPWTAKRSNQSILKEINPDYSLKGLMLKLKFQYFGHL